VRCTNQHYVPNGFAYCRRCQDEPQAAVLTAPRPADRADVLTVAAYLDERDRLGTIAAAVVAAATVAAAGSSPAALLPAVLAAAVAAVLARVAIGARKPISRGDAPASALHVRTLDRLVLVPVIAVAVAVIAAFVRW